MNPAIRLVSMAVLAVAIAIAVGASARFRSAPDSNSFPGESIRTAQAPPAIALTNQLGEPFDLDSTAGEVVILTAVYATCPHTCPAVLQQTKRVVGKLPEEFGADVRVLGVTLNPEEDDAEAMKALADRHGLEAPRYQLLTGDVAAVDEILDGMGMVRQANSENGEIDHPSLLLVIDRNGKVAYRFGLSELQEAWLSEALRQLLGEVKPVAG